MNKKGEGRISTIVYAITISLAMMVLFGALTIQMANEYDVSDVPEFESFNATFGVYESYTDELTESIELTDEDTNQSTGFLGGFYDRLENAWSESTLRRGYNTVSLIPKLVFHTAHNIAVGLSHLTFYIPVPIKWLITVLPILAIVFIFLKALWERKT